MHVIDEIQQLIHSQTKRKRVGLPLLAHDYSQWDLHWHVDGPKPTGQGV
jgi:hypothetical protein